MADQKCTLPPPKFWDTEFFQKHARTALDFALNDYQSELIARFERWDWNTESPIESIFAIWWTVIEQRSFNRLHLSPQVAIEAAGESWRLDFQVLPTAGQDYGALVNSSLCPLIAVELDGHDFHERTREQVDLRNRRDRALTSNGWLVWHVSGSELHASPYRSVSTILSLSSAEFDKAMYAAGYWTPTPRS